MVAGADAGPVWRDLIKTRGRCFSLIRHLARDRRQVFCGPMSFLVPERTVEEIALQNLYRY